MSLIACTSTCVYQQDGCCRLDQAASTGQAQGQNAGCVHFVQNSGKHKTPNPLHPPTPDAT